MRGGVRRWVRVRVVRRRTAAATSADTTLGAGVHPWDCAITDGLANKFLLKVAAVQRVLSSYDWVV